MASPKLLGTVIHRSRYKFIVGLRAVATLKNMAASRTRLKVDIWSDVVCPWCWVGKRHLDLAMEAVKDEIEFSITWKPFLLNPNVPEEGMPVEEVLKRKYGPQTAEVFLSGKSPFVQAGSNVGLNFTLNRLAIPTKKAHLLLDFAHSKGKQHDLQENLFRAYFADGRNVNSVEVLSELLKESGLDVAEALRVLEDEAAMEKYDEEVREAFNKGIKGVPFFEISLIDKPKKPRALCSLQPLSGAQPVDTFVQTFKNLQTLSKL